MLGGVQVQSCPFYEKPYFKVLSNHESKRNEPSVEIKNDPLVLVLKLVKAGYGDIEVVKRMSSREFLQAVAFEKFERDYQVAYMELNK